MECKAATGQKASFIARPYKRFFLPRYYIVAVGLSLIVGAGGAPTAQAGTVSERDALVVSIHPMDAKRAIGLAVIAAPGVRLVEGQPLPGAEVLPLSMRSRLVVDSSIDEKRRIWSIEIKSGTTVSQANSLCRKLISSGKYTRCDLFTVS